MNRDEFNSALEADFDPMISLLQSLRPEQVEQPLAEGKWSLRDLAAHLMYWDSVVIRALEAHWQGETFDWEEYSNWDARNAEAIERMRGAPLKRMAAEWRITHFALVEALARIPDENLLENGEIPHWLCEIVADHYRHHAQQVKEWAERVKKEGGMKSGGELPVLR